MYYDSPHFPEEDTEIQRSNLGCLDSRTRTAFGEISESQQFHSSIPFKINS